MMINQTVTEKGRGNCMQAALASLFNIDVNDAINVIDYIDSGWQIPLLKWVESIGYDYSGVCSALRNMDKTKVNLKNSDNVNGHVLAVVPSKNFNGVSHAVLINLDGLVIHDPHPLKGYQGVNIVETSEICYWYLFSKVVSDD